MLLAGWVNIYYNMRDLKHLGKYDPEADDERDQLINLKKDRQVLKIIENLMLFGGAIVLLIAVKVNNETLSTVLIFIGLFMELLWWVIMILKAIFLITNYQKY